MRSERSASASSFAWQWSVSTRMFCMITSGRGKTALRMRWTMKRCSEKVVRKIAR